MIILLGIPLACLIIAMCLLFGWLVPADKAKQLREDIEDRLPRTPLSPYDHKLLPGGNWASLRATNDYWAARFTYQETNALADLDKMLACVTLDYPPLEMLENAPDDPPALPESHPLEHVDVNELRNMPLNGGAGGSSTATIAYGGDQRGSEALYACAECKDAIPCRADGMNTVLCEKCQRNHQLAEYARKEPGKCPKCAVVLPYTRGTTDVLCGGCWADSQVFSHHGIPPVRGVVSRHDDLVQEERELAAKLDAVYADARYSATQVVWDSLTSEEINRMTVSEFAEFRRRAGREAPGLTGGIHE